MEKFTRKIEPKKPILIGVVLFRRFRGHQRMFKLVYVGERFVEDYIWASWTNLDE